MRIIYFKNKKKHAITTSNEDVTISETRDGNRTTVKLEALADITLLKADVTYVDDKSGIVSSIYGFELWYKNLGDDIDMDSKSIKKIYDILTKEMETNSITKEEHINNIKRKHGNE